MDMAFLGLKKNQPTYTISKPTHKKSNLLVISYFNIFLKNSLLILY
jgi:hypothetical protein